MRQILTKEKYLKAISFDELIKATNECVRGVKWKESTAKFYTNRLYRIAELRQLLKTNKYKLQNYIKFMTFDPKPREICATRIRDRVLQRSLCNNGLYDAFVNPFIYDNLACQKGKGITASIKRMKYHLNKYFHENNTNEGYYLKLDIHHYFESTPHEELKKIVKYYIREENFQKIVFDIIDSFDDKRSDKEIKLDPFGKRGIGLGSQCSQLLQLLYLNDVDHYIKEQLKVAHYIRYMDDMILLARTKEHANFLLQKIKEILERKGLTLNKKSKISRIQDNIQFCKIIYKLSKSGKIKTKVVRKTFNREIRRIRKYKQLLKDGKISIKDLIQHGNTWYGFAKWRCSGKQIKFIKDLFRNTFSEFKGNKELIKYKYQLM